jgi:hypothetical protein
LSGFEEGLVRVVQQFRGILMLVAAGIAFYRGWKIHSGDYAVMAYVLGALALGLAVWHLTRRAPQRRV